jgi:hypothetical protein
MAGDVLPGDLDAPGSTEDLRVALGRQGQHDETVGKPLGGWIEHQVTPVRTKLGEGAALGLTGLGIVRARKCSRIDDLDMGKESLDATSIVQAGQVLAGEA